MANFMRRSGSKTNRRTKRPKSKVEAPVLERRVATPNPDLLVVKIGDSSKKVKVSRKEQVSSVLATVAKVMKKPGADRSRIFDSTSGKPVFAYSVYSKDPTKVVREDVSGRRTLGRFAGGRFRPITTATAD